MGPAIPVETDGASRARATVGAPLGTSASQLAAVGGAAGRSSALAALLLPDYSSGRQRQADLAEAGKELQLAAPAVRFSLKLHIPPLPDGSGGFFYVAPPKVLKDVGPKAVSAVRRDLMTAIVAVGRELVSASPRVVLGHGQGGLVAALVAFPRILESALAIVYAREPEGVQIAEAWRNVRVFIAISPSTSRSQLE